MLPQILFEEFGSGWEVKFKIKNVDWHKTQTKYSNESHLTVTAWGHLSINGGELIAPKLKDYVATIFLSRSLFAAKETVEKKWA